MGDGSSPESQMIDGQKSFRTRFNPWGRFVPRKAAGGVSAADYASFNPWGTVRPPKV